MTYLTLPEDSKHAVELNFEKGVSSLKITILNDEQQKMQKIARLNGKTKIGEWCK